MNYRRLLLGIVAFFFHACAKLPEDYAPNPAVNGFHNMEFDVVDNTQKYKHVLGVANILLYEGQNLEKLYIDVTAPYKGTMTLKSDSCPVNFSVRYNQGKVRFLLGNLLGDQARNCIITLVANTDPIAGVKYQGLESGKIETYVVKKDLKPVTFSYSQATPFGLKTNHFYAVGNLQKQEGSIVFDDTFLVSTESTKGMYMIRNTCNLPVLNGEYASASWTTSLRTLYSGKNYLRYQADNCDFYFTLFPTDGSGVKGFEGKFSVTVYSKDVVPLEYASYRITPGLITVWGASNVAISAVNGRWTRGATLNTYNKNDIYWIRLFTATGRKSVFALQNGRPIWY